MTLPQPPLDPQFAAYLKAAQIKLHDTIAGPYANVADYQLEALIKAVAKRCAELCKPPTNEPGWMGHCHDEQVETAACEGCATAIRDEFGIDGARQAEG